MELLVSHRVDLHRIAYRVVFELLLQHVVSISAIFVLLLHSPLPEVVLGSLINSFVVADVNAIVDTRAQLYEPHLVLVLRLLLVGHLLHGRGHLSHLLE